MCQAIAGFRPDAILVYGWSSLTHLSVLLQFHRKVPLLFRGDSTLLSHDHGWKLFLRRPLLTWVYRHIDRALYVGQRNLEYFLAHGVPQDRLSWAPHSVENDRFASHALDLQIEADRERSALGIPRDAIVFLFAGKFVRRKQPALLIDAFRLAIRDMVPNAHHLVMVGAGPLERELREQARDLPTVHFGGFRNQSQMPTVYRLGDVFVLPSSRDTWGLAVNEAMASARPVIVSDQVGCAPDLAQGRRYASVFESGNLRSLASALAKWSKPRQEILEDGALAQESIGCWSTEAAATAIAENVLAEVCDA